jgi:hypothetical protein
MILQACCTRYKPKITRAKATPFDDVSNLGLVQSAEVTVRQLTPAILAQGKCTGSFHLVNMQVNVL